MMVARTGRRGCPALDELLDSWGGDLTPPWRRRVSRHAATCAACAERMHWALGPAMLLSLAPLVSPPADMRGHILDLVAQDSPDAVAYRGRVVDRAGPFDPAGFPVQIAPAGWAGRSGRARQGRRRAVPEPGRAASLARRRTAAAAVASLLVVAAAVGGIALLGSGGGRGRLADGSVGTAAPFGVPGSAASGDPAGSLAPRSPSGKPLLARSSDSGSPSPSPRARTSPAAPSPHRSVTATGPPEDPPPSHTSAPQPPPPVLSESPGEVVLEPNEVDVTGSFTLTAANGPISYSISTESRAVSVSVPLTGTVTPGQPLTVTVTYRGSLGRCPTASR